MVTVFETIFKSKDFSEEQTLIIYLTAMGCSVLLSLFYDFIRYHIVENYMKSILDFIVCVLISMPFAGVLGNRADSVGYDTGNYVANYIRYGSLEGFGIRDGEPGYVFLMKIIHFFSNGSIEAMLFIMAFITIFLVSYSLLKVKRKGVLPLGLFMYYATCGLNLGNQSRQLLAIAVVIYAVSFLKNNNVTVYIFLCLIAITIHLSSCIALALIFINRVDSAKVNIRKVVFWACFVTTFLLWTAPQVFYIFLPGRYKYIIEKAISSESVGIKWILDTLPIVAATFMTNYASESKELNDRIPWFAIPFRLGGYTSYFIMRLYYYPHTFGIYSVSCNYAVLKNRKQKRVIFMAILILFGVYFYFNNVVYDEHNMMNYSRRIL